MASAAVRSPDTAKPRKATRRAPQPTERSVQRPKPQKPFDYVSAFWAKVDQSGGGDACWPWIAKAKTNGGYGLAWFDLGRGLRVHVAHRVALFLTTGRRVPPGMDTLHSCDNRLCCNPAHLSIGTRKENMQDMARKGRWLPRDTKPPKGERHWNSKLSAADIPRIRAARGQLRVLAKELGVSLTAIADVRRRATWAHVE